MLENENSEFKLCLKIDLVSHPVRAERLGNYLPSQKIFDTNELNSDRMSIGVDVSA